LGIDKRQIADKSEIGRSDNEILIEANHAADNQGIVHEDIDEEPKSSLVNVQLAKLPAERNRDRLGGDGLERNDKHFSLKAQRERIAIVSE